MRHVSLYRKWRPRTFDAVVGQEPVVRTLKRAVETGRVAHAYLFSGPRGTGKTSTAKVLAMGLNCERGPTPEPDGTCASCRAIINNSSMDVLEMDAASNRGIDEIRDLRDKVNLAPVAARTKVYIIDEFHMLTTEAFNALLKMLEEPPEHVVFVLATTEKHKVPPTIVSRCQSFDFRRPSVALLSEKLREIAAAEGIEAEPEALTIIAREGRGSFRDAEGLLDQLASFSDGPVTSRQVRELLGSVGSDVLLETTDALYERRAAEAMRLLDRLSNEGKDLSQFVGELVAHLRRLMLLPDAPEVALAEVGTEERAGLEEQAGRVPTAEVVRMIEALGATISRAKRGGDPKLELELTFLKLARDYQEPPVEALLARLEALEKAVANGSANHRPAVAPADRVEPGPTEEPETNGTVEERPVREAGQGSPGRAEQAQGGGRQTGEDGGAGGASVGSLDWGSVMRELRERRQVPAAAFYENASAGGYADGVLEILFPKSMETLVRFAEDAKYMEPLREILEQRLGSRPRLQFRVTDGDAGTPRALADDGASPRTAPQSAPERRSEPVSEPGKGDEPPRGQALGMVDPAPGPAVADDPDGEGGAQTDATIRSTQEVFEMFRERFGGPGGKQNGGS